MFLIVFNKIAKIPTDSLPPVLFYMSSITIWIIFPPVWAVRLPLCCQCRDLWQSVFSAAGITAFVHHLQSCPVWDTGTLLIAMMIYYAAIGVYTVHPGWQLLLVPRARCGDRRCRVGDGIIISSLTTRVPRPEYPDFPLAGPADVYNAGGVPHVVPRTIKIHQPDPVEPAFPRWWKVWYAVLGQGSLILSFWL